MDEQQPKQFMEVSYSCDSCLRCGSFVVERGFPLKGIVVRAQVHHANEFRSRPVGSYVGCSSQDGKRVRVYAVKVLKDGTIPERIAI